jgi:tRNA threonylcarbamoyladenosine biosynthesis protein TsaB
MKIMGIDSSTPQGSVAILEDGRILAQAEVDKNSTFSNQILNLIDTVLSKSNTGLENVDGFCLTTGPGSFTGLRVGASVLKGLILATSKPFVKIDTLEATALRATPADNVICAVLDAKKKELYTASFRGDNGALERITPDRAIVPEELCQEIKEPTIFIGNGLDSYGDLLASRLEGNFLRAPTKLPYTVAACAVRLVENHFDDEKLFDLNELNIKYVRKSEAELNFARFD